MPFKQKQLVKKCRSHSGTSTEWRYGFSLMLEFLLSFTTALKIQY